MSSLSQPTQPPFTQLFPVGTPGTPRAVKNWLQGAALEFHRHKSPLPTKFPHGGGALRPKRPGYRGDAYLPRE